MPGKRAVLGIDLRVAAVKAVEIEKTPSGFTLKNWGASEVPYQLLDKHPQIEDTKADLLRKLVQSHNMQAHDAVAVVGGGEVFVKLLSLDSLPPEEILQAIKWKFAEEIPFPAEEALFDFYALEKNNYLAACISRKLYNNLAYIVKKSGLNLIGITVLPDALREVFAEEIKKEGDKTVSLIYMGKRTTNISVFRKGKFEFNRELNIGGENLTMVMSGIVVSPEGKIEISPEQAEKIKIEYGIPLSAEDSSKAPEVPLAQLNAMVRPALEKIQSEITRTFEYYKGQSGAASIDKIILTGGTSQTRHFSEFLSEGIGIPVVVPKESQPNLGPRMTGALGAALVETKKINLLPEEIKFRWKRMMEKLSSPPVVLLAFVCLLALFYLFNRLHTFGLQKEIDNMDQKAQLYKPLLIQVEAFEQAARKKIPFSILGEKTGRIPKILEEISRVIPGSVFLNSANLTPGNLRLLGTASEKGETAENVLSRFVLSLSNSLLLENVQLVQANKNKDYLSNAFDFEITAKIRAIPWK